MRKSNKRFVSFNPVLSNRVSGDPELLSLCEHIFAYSWNWHNSINSLNWPWQDPVLAQRFIESQIKNATQIVLQTEMENDFQTILQVKNEKKQ